MSTPSRIYRELMKLHQPFEAFLRVQFKDKPGESKVVNEQYHIIDLDNQGSIVEKEHWRRTIRRGSKLTMSMVMSLVKTSPGRCPRHKCLGTRFTVCETSGSLIWYDPRLVCQLIDHDCSRLSLSSNTCSLIFSSSSDVLENTFRRTTVLEEEEVARRQVAEDLRLFGSRLQPADPVDTDASVNMTTPARKRSAFDFGVSLDRPNKYHKIEDKTDCGTTAVTAVDWNSGKTRIDAWLNQCAVPLVVPPIRCTSDEANWSAETSAAIETEVEEIGFFRNIHIASLPYSRDNREPSRVPDTTSDLELRPMIYYRNILDKYPLLPTFLARRLAKANHARAGRLQNTDTNSWDQKDPALLKNQRPRPNLLSEGNKRPRHESTEANNKEKVNGRVRRRQKRDYADGSDGPISTKSIKGQPSNAYDTALQQKYARKRKIRSDHHSPPVSDFWSGGKASPSPATADSHSSGVNTPLRGHDSCTLEDQDLDLPSQGSSGSYSGLSKCSSGLPPPPVEIRNQVLFDCDICNRKILVSRRLEWQ